jgi:hypothetical protein
LVIILNYFGSKKKKKKGNISSLFLILYPFFKILNGFTPKPQIPPGLLLVHFTMGPLINLFGFFPRIPLGEFKKNG